MAEFLLIALLLGIKHSFDADHLLAVSNLLTKAGSIRKTVKLATNWTIGHMGGAVFVTILLFMFKDSLLPLIFEKFEIVVALMLIAFGLLGLYQSRFLHRHTHKHNGRTHTHIHLHLKSDESNHIHKHMMGVGLLQGLASNDELLLLLTVFLGLTSLASMVAGVILFSIGVFIGMIIFSTAFSLLKSNAEKWGRALNGTVGLASIIYGLMMLA